MKYWGYVICIVACEFYEVYGQEQTPKPHNPSAPVKYPPDACKDIDQDKQWDYVVVGSGPAGATLARRLAEDEKVQVLVLEAGQDPPSSTDIPGNVLYDEKLSWNIVTMEKDNQFQGRVGKVAHYPQGKFLGGSSVINQMMYTRGNHRDYDEWEEAGCPGWGWNNILPYFKKLENFVDPRGQLQPDVEYHNQGGPFTTSPSQVDPQTEPFRKALMKAMENNNIPYTNDHNGKKQTGFGDLTGMLEGNGYRDNIAKAYLLDIPDNLKICKSAVVQKILLSDKTATGIEYIHNNGEKRVVKAKEYIISAGPVSSPQILERSGIGQKEVLKAAKVDLIHELNGVGENLYEQVGNAGCAFEMDINTQSEANPLSLALASFSLFLNLTDYSHPVPDMQWIFTGFSLKFMKGFSSSITTQFKKLLEKKFIVASLPVVLRQDNPGFVHIAGTDPMESPKFQINQFTTERETKFQGEACRLMRTIMKDPAVASFNTKPVIIDECKKYKFNSDEEIMCHASYMTFPFFHIAGTTRMGPASNNMSVVDTEMRVHGIKKLRVVDLGIMPMVPRANTEIPTIAISEMAADIIKKGLKINT